jgi:hypothetical protein
MALKVTQSDSVFINCPFDDGYSEFFHCIVFTVYRCGFYPRCAKEEDDALDTRIDKIMKIISECRYGINDISRIEPDVEGYPRFNMPFELGLYFAARKYGDLEQKKKKALILERTQYTYQRYISDLNGIDTCAHEGNKSRLITHIRNWLSTASRRTTIPGQNIIIEDFEDFYDNALPIMLNENGLDLPNLTFNDLCLFIEEWLKVRLAL